MEYRTLGNSDLRASVLGFGCYRIADKNRDAQEAQAAIGEAIELGVNFFDTAARYADGESERLFKGVLTGALLDGTPFEGMDSIRIVLPNGSNRNSLQISAVPEPTTCGLALAALCLAMSRRRSF